jgi:hypothetical protein
VRCSSRTAGRVGDDLRELLDDGQLLGAVEGPQIREHLDAYIVALARDIGDRPLRQ